MAMLLIDMHVMAGASELLRRGKAGFRRDVDASGQMEGMDERGGTSVVRGLVPLAQMFGVFLNALFPSVRFNRSIQRETVLRGRLFFTQCGSPPCDAGPRTTSSLSPKSPRD